MPCHTMPSTLAVLPVPLQVSERLSLATLRERCMGMLKDQIHKQAFGFASDIDAMTQLAPKTHMEVREEEQGLTCR